MILGDTDVSDETQSQIQIEHVFKASAQRVFDAWINPAIIRQWMFGTRIREETVLNIRTDAQVGGSFSFSVERNEQIIDYVGEYFIVDPPQRLVFTWAVEENSTESDHVIVDFKSDKSACRLTLVHNLNSHRLGHPADIFQDWAKMFAVLEKVLAGR